MGTKVKCLTCEAIIESKYRHDFVSCECEPHSKTWIAVDGGDDYFKMSFMPEAKWEEIDASNSDT